MGKNSKIEWTHHTFNPWWGCVKVSAACKHCYAEMWSRRLGKEIWGRNTRRRFFSEQHWRQPLMWNRHAENTKSRKRVFCASMGDVFEDRDDLDVWRERLWELIEKTPSLDWLLLTKRPERIAGCVPWHDTWPQNVWLGTTVETQHWAEKRIPHLIANRSVVRFLSCEPLLGPLDLTAWLGADINWVIAGGESGAKSRPSQPLWFRSLRDQCAETGVAFHFKQWGNWTPTRKTKNADGAARFELANGEIMVRLKKALAGRALDGETWNEIPKM
jgi:protein gp37